jgi:ketosteroid isomerase-like protein
MSDQQSVQRARAFLDSLAKQRIDLWPQLVTEDFVMMFPFAPPGIPQRCEGRTQCIEMLRPLFGILESMQWHDLELHACDEPGLVMGTGRSEGKTTSGQYRNNYCFAFRFEADRLREYREYFNPLPVIESFLGGSK